MSNVFGLQIQGINQLNLQFNQLTIQLQKKIVKTAFRKITKPIITESRQKLRNWQNSNIRRKPLTKNTSKSLGLKIFKSGTGLIIGARVTGGFKGQLAYIIDKGTTIRKTNSGYNRGKINASNFFSSTVQQHQNSVITDVQNQVQSLFT